MSGLISKNTVISLMVILKNLIDLHDSINEAVKQKLSFILSFVVALLAEFRQVLIKNPKSAQSRTETRQGESALRPLKKWYRDQSWDLILVLVLILVGPWVQRQHYYYLSQWDTSLRAQMPEEREAEQFSRSASTLPEKARHDSAAGRGWGVPRGWGQTRSGYWRAGDWERAADQTESALTKPKV